MCVTDWKRRSSPPECFTGDEIGLLKAISWIGSSTFAPTKEHLNNCFKRSSFFWSVSFDIVMFLQTP